MEENTRCTGSMPSKAHEEIVIKLARIEEGQKFLCDGLQNINVAINRIAVQEERQVTLQSQVEAAWKKIDRLKEAQDKCPIQNLCTQVHWVWVFLSGCAVGLVLLFIGRIT